MKGVRFDDYHCESTFGLWMSSKEVSPPTPKITMVDIEGRDGALDLTDARVRFENRRLNINFQTFSENQPQAYSNLMDKIHGQKMKITFDDDPTYYYWGRVMVNPWKSNRLLGTVSVTCDCEPWKYKHELTVKTNNINTTATLNYYSQRMPVVPEFTTTIPLTIKFGTFTTTHSAGTFIIPEIEFKEGWNNTIQYTGASPSTVTLRYREGRL